jgi:CheY-like chemotaxis protein
MARILIVDDEEADRLLQRTILEGAGHQLFFAQDGEDAVRAYMKRGIEIVITDLKMPNVDGLELITVLGEFIPAPHIIAISATGPEQLTKARALGAVTTLAKPVDPDELLRAVENAVSES